MSGFVYASSGLGSRLLKVILLFISEALKVVVHLRKRECMLFVGRASDVLLLYCKGDLTQVRKHFENGCHKCAL